MGAGLVQAEMTPNEQLFLINTSLKKVYGNYIANRRVETSLT